MGINERPTIELCSKTGRLWNTWIRLNFFFFFIKPPSQGPGIYVKDEVERARGGK